jgi:hypothetical protein
VPFACNRSFGRSARVPAHAPKRPHVWLPVGDVDGDGRPDRARIVNLRRRPRRFDRRHLANPAARRSPHSARQRRNTSHARCLWVGDAPGRVLVSSARAAHLGWHCDDRWKGVHGELGSLPSLGRNTGAALIQPPPRAGCANPGRHLHPLCWTTSRRLTPDSEQVPLCGIVPPQSAGVQPALSTVPDLHHDWASDRPQTRLVVERSNPEAFHRK